MEVLQTKNYQQFRMVMSNREVDEKHVKRLVKSIREKNLLNLNPIVVDEEMAVIDGQHRLEAAKELDLPVFYIVSGNIKKEDISRINSNSKNWAPMDYINYYTVEGRKEYIEISRLINQYPGFSVSAVLALASGWTSGSKEFKNGYINISNIHQAREILDLANTLRNKMYDFATQRNLTNALKICFDNTEFDKVELMAQIEKQPRSFVPCVNTRQYLEMIEELYNYHKHSHNKIRLR
jgi:disulfide oxidoreductase YuzD